MSEGEGVASVAAEAGDAAPGLQSNGVAATPPSKKGCADMAATPTTAGGEATGGIEEKQDVMGSALPGGVAAKAFCGIDFGSFKAVVASSSAASPHAVNVDINNLSNRSTPSIVSFQLRVRHVGESAEDRVMKAADNSITQLITLFCTTTKATHVTSNEEVTSTADAVVSSPPLVLSDVRRRMAWRLRGRPAVRSPDSCGSVSFQVDFDNQSLDVTLRHLSAFFLRSCFNFCVRARGLLEAPDACPLTVAVPSYFNNDALSAFVDSCCIAGLNNVSILRQSDAIRNLWVARNVPSILNGSLQRATFAAATAATAETEEQETKTSHPEWSDEDCCHCPTVVGFVDLGFSQTSVQFVCVTPPPERPATSDAAEAGQKHAPRTPSRDKPTVQVLGQMCDGQLGTADMLDPMIRKACQKLEAAYGEEAKVDLSSRRGWRLSLGATKLLKDLSGLTNSSIELDGFVDEMTDFKMLLSREEFEDLCAPLKERFQKLVDDCLSHARASMGCDFTSPPQTTDGTSKPSHAFCGVELVGGGSRVPWVQRVVEEAIGGDTSEQSTTTLLRRTMDSSAAAAAGAALFSSGERWVRPLFSSNSGEGLAGDVAMDIQDTVVLETRIQSVEKTEMQRREKFNDFESFILQMRSAISKRTDLFGSAKEQFEAAIDKADDSLLDLDPDETPLEKYTEMYDSLQLTLRTICPAYFDAVEAEKLDKEKALEAATQQTRDAGGGLEKDDDDHDSRKLPTSQRIKLAKKNKDEGNDLFKGGTLESAAQRYIKSLSHLSKVFDSSPQDELEIAAVKFACHLNLAQVYFRLGTETSFKKAVASSTAALELNDSSVKALFRRAQGHEKLREFDKSMEDLKRASTITEGKDVDVQKAIDRVQRFIQKEKEKEKKMYSRMFCGKAD